MTSHDVRKYNDENIQVNHCRLFEMLWNVWYGVTYMHAGKTWTS